MNDSLDTVERLAAKIRPEENVQVDIADRVLLRLRQAPRAPVRSAAAILVCAAAAAVLFMPLLDLVSDPWNALYLFFAG